MFESKKLMKCDIEVLKADVVGLGNRVDRVYERLDNRFTVQNNTIKHLTDQIELLNKQVRQLARIANCKITSPTEATPGGEVKKLTEEEIASRESLDRMFTTGSFFQNPFYIHGKSIAAGVVSDLQRGKTSKKASKKKKK